MNRVQRNSYNESAFAFRESQKSPQHNPQFRVNMSKTVTKAHAYICHVEAVRARDHRTGAKIYVKIMLLNPVGERTFSKQMDG